MASLGRHVLVEKWECDSRIDDVEAIGRAIDEAVLAIGATLVQSHVHRYSPQGVTGLAILSESHLSLHSWPEYGYLAADVFTCGTLTVPRRAVAVFERLFEPGWTEVREVERSGRRSAGGRGRHPVRCIDDQLPQLRRTADDSGTRRGTAGRLPVLRGDARAERRQAEIPRGPGRSQAYSRYPPGQHRGFPWRDS